MRARDEHGLGNPVRTRPDGTIVMDMDVSAIRTHNSHRIAKNYAHTWSKNVPITIFRFPCVSVLVAGGEQSRTGQACDSLLEK